MNDSWVKVAVPNLLIAATFAGLSAGLRVDLRAMNRQQTAVLRTLRERSHLPLLDERGPIPWPPATATGIALGARSRCFMALRDQLILL